MRLIVAHQTEGRTRLRASVRPIDVEALMAFADRLAEVPGVELLDCRATTGSIVIEHPELDISELLAAVAQLGGSLEWPAHDPETRRDSLAPVRGAVGTVDGLLSQLTAGGVDFRTLGFVLMFSLAVRQIMRGQVMVPAMSFLWWAFEILGRSSPLSNGDGVDGSSD